MPALTTLSPNADGSISNAIDHDAGRSGDYFSHFNEDPDSPGSDHVTNDQSEQDGTYFVGLPDVDADFGSIIDLAIKASTQAFDDGSSNDALDLYVQVFAADESTPYSDEVIISDETFTSKQTNTDTLTPNAAGLAATRAQWNAAFIRFRWDYQKTAAGDNNQINVFAFELDGNYEIPVIVGDGALAEDPDTLAAAGVHTHEITGALVQDPDTLAAEGTVGGTPIDGDGALVEAADLLAATGIHDIEGAGALAEESDSLSASGLHVHDFIGSLDEADDTVAAAGAHDIEGSGLSAETGDLVAASGVHTIEGTGSLTQQGDTVTGVGIIGAIPGVTARGRRRKKMRLPIQKGRL